MQLRGRIVLFIIIVFVMIGACATRPGEKIYAQEDGIVISASDVSEFPIVSISVTGMLDGTSDIGVVENGELVTDIIPQVKEGSGRHLAFLIDMTASSVTHVVQSGEGLWSIAAQYGITVNELREANGIPASTNIIREGDELIIPVGSGQSGASATALTIKTGEALRSKISDNDTASPYFADQDEFAFFVPNADGRSLRTVKSWTPEEQAIHNIIYEPANQPYLPTSTSQGELPATTDLRALLTAALSQFDRSFMGPKALILVTSATDDLSDSAIGEIVDLANEQGVRIYAALAKPAAATGSDARQDKLTQLQNLTSATGGDVREFMLDGNASGALDHVWVTLPGSATVTYRSRNPELHTIAIEAAGQRSNEITLPDLAIQPPEVRIAGPAPGDILSIARGEKSRTVPMEVAWSYAPPLSRNTQAVEYSIDNGAPISVDLSDKNTAIFEIPAVSLGEHHVSVSVVDELSLTGIAAVNFSVTRPPGLRAPAWALGLLAVVAIAGAGYWWLFAHRKDLSSPVRDPSESGVPDVGFSGDGTRIYAEKKTPNARLVLVNVRAGERPSETIDIVKEITKLGRPDGAGSVDVPIRNEFITRVHCRITEVNGQYLVFDEGSKSGTFVNEALVSMNEIPERPITHGDILRLGPLEYQFELVSSPPVSTGPSPDTEYYGYPTFGPQRGDNSLPKTEDMNQTSPTDSFDYGSGSDYPPGDEDKSDSSGPPAIPPTEII
ncbi:MAG: LysM peptidoglycan-binding domain-containing protein [Caldilineaceae bacterium]|nr:LysM peptidoglycan-binding domain-containing protein [Caldilineaceae bacterium]